MVTVLDRDLRNDISVDIPWWTFLDSGVANVGVVSALQGREFREGTPEFGEAFGTLLMHEFVCYRDYVAHEPLAFWRSMSGYEVDFIIGDHSAVEAKAKRNVSPADLRSLVALPEEKKFKRYICLRLEPRARREGNITIIPFLDFLRSLWDGDFK